MRRTGSATRAYGLGLRASACRATRRFTLAVRSSRADLRSSISRAEWSRRSSPLSLTVRRTALRPSRSTSLARSTTSSTRSLASSTTSSISRVMLLRRRFPVATAVLLVRSPPLFWYPFPSSITPRVGGVKDRDAGLRQLKNQARSGSRCPDGVSRGRQVKPPSVALLAHPPGGAVGVEGDPGRRPVEPGVAVAGQEDPVLTVQAGPGALGGDAGRAARHRRGQHHGFPAGLQLAGGGPPPA